jgi:flagellar hook-length control protein FliK
VDRIESLAAHRPRGTVVIRLDPPELGTITLTVQQFGGRVDAGLCASNDCLLAALEQNRGHLGQAIEQKGFQVGNLRFDPPSQAPGFGQPQHGAHDPSARQDAQGYHSPLPGQTPDLSAPAWPAMASDGLDLRL